MMQGIFQISEEKTDFLNYIVLNQLITYWKEK